MDASASFTMKLPLDRITVLSMDPGAYVGLSGRVTASMDGSSFDAASLFDFAAGGLRVVDADPAHFAYIVEPTGEHAPACAAVGNLPCLVPRLARLAHQRLHTAAELASTLSGSIELDSHPQPSAVPAVLGGLALAVSCIGVILGAGWALVVLSRRAARTPLGRIRVVARQALRATRGDATLEGARTQIRALLDRAQGLDAMRRACARKLARIDRGALDRRAAACAGAAVPMAAAALASFSAERAAAMQLETDHGSVVLELERIVSVLTIAALRVGHAGRAGAGGACMRLRQGSPAFADPADALVTELDLRDEAFAEADAP
jgi:hypothetical protein